MFSARPAPPVASLAFCSGCLEAPCSAASSVISFSRRRRRELDEDVSDPEAVWSAHAEDSAVSVRSSGEVRGNVVSCGVKVSVTDWK
jgi:ribulose 1,5-bisphosphate synthetase/thiazole synthase